jgi:hypothetical protein
MEQWSSLLICRCFFAGEICLCSFLGMLLMHTPLRAVQKLVGTLKTLVIIYIIIVIIIIITTTTSTTIIIIFIIIFIIIIITSSHIHQLKQWLSKYFRTACFSKIRVCSSSGGSSSSSSGSGSSSSSKTGGHVLCFKPASARQNTIERECNDRKNETFTAETV